MKVFKRISLIIFLGAIVFVTHLLVSTGFFRKISSNEEKKILDKIAIKGAEDITISEEDNFAIISATNRSDYSENGALHLVDLNSENFKTINLTKFLNFDFHPHGISYYKKDSTYHILAVNHPKKGHTIEAFTLRDTVLKHVKTLKNPTMFSPNDLVMIDENRFYFTNDHAFRNIWAFIEEFLGLALTNVVYFDGKEYKEVAKNISYANGINFDKKRNLMFVASPRKFLIKVYSRKEDGTLSFIEDIDCGTGVDNIEFDTNGDLWVGAHPSLLKFLLYMMRQKKIAPSEIIKIAYRNTGDYSVDSIFLDDGNQISASTVAAVSNNLIFVGSVNDDEILVLKNE